MAGRWEKFLETKDTRPYLMYDAINDSRVRPSHLALDGIIRRIDDPFWKTHACPNGYRCRCSLRSLTERQALDRSRDGKGINQSPVLADGTPAEPDKGWDYNPSDRLAGVNKAIEEKRGKVSDVLMNALTDKLAGMKNKITPEFIPAKTVKEAARWAVDNNLVDYADYAGVKVEVANAFNQSLFEHVRDFPELRDNQQFIGTIQAQFAKFRDNQIKDYLVLLRKDNPDIEEKVLIEYAQKKIKLIKLTKTDNRTAQSWMQEGVKGISVNKKWGADIDRYKDMLLASAELRWHPVGTGTIKCDADHEFGHQLDALLNLKNDDEIKLLFSGFKYKHELSEYALSSIEEFIAEGWSEFRNDVYAGEFSKKIGNIILDRYARLKK